MNYSISRKDLWLSKSVINGVGINVPRKQEIHFNKRMVIFVTTLFFITILLWPLNKNVQSPGEKNTVCLF